MARKLDPEIERITRLPVEFADVLKTYSGRAGACCCGCSGDYRYPATQQEAGGRDRGYTVDDDEVSDRGVKIILGKLNRLIAAGEAYGPLDGLYVAGEVGERIYIAYLTPAGQLDRGIAAKQEAAEADAAAAAQQAQHEAAGEIAVISL